ncbi:MAG: hypothetical protein MJZ88_05455 [Paludibacteraceae bacterium]|nr:hypothetical protein [Paludibacteraceae bacterium]
MATIKCPECGAEIPAGTHICPNCDYELSESEYAAQAPEAPTAPAMPAQPEVPTTSVPSTKPAKPNVQAPESVMAHGNVDASVHNVQNTTQNTQNVTNTFIIMGGGSAPLPNNIDPQTAAAVQQAQQQAQRQQHVQPQPQPQPQPSEPLTAETGEKGLGSIDGRRRPVSGGRNKWIGIVIGVIVAVVVFFIFFKPSGEKKMGNEPSAPAKTEQVTNIPTSSQTTAKPATKQAAKSETKSSAQTSAQPAAQPTAQQATVAKPVDANYEKGMKAYQEGNGLDAVAAFNASGSKESLLMLAKIYEKGCGSVAANAMLAHKYKQKASEK